MSGTNKILPLRPDLNISDKPNETREEKLFRLQKLIDQDKYHVSSEDIAEALLKADKAESRKNSKK